jgi:hypothetical protein
MVNQMLAKKFALAFGIAVVFPAMIHSGVSIFYAPPRWEDYTVAPGTAPGADEWKKKQTERRAAEKVFENHLFAVAVPLGLIAIIAGAFFLSPAIGTGLMFGGVFSVCDGYISCWSELSPTLRFLSLLAVFVVLLLVGYRRIERKEINRELPPTAA